MVKIFEHPVGPDGVAATIYSHSELWRYQASGYQRVPERTWGKLDENSPISGLCTDLADSCLIFVSHCNSTRRTTLMHTPSMVDIQIIMDQLEYLTNGASMPVEIVVLKGALYAERRRRELADEVQRCIDADLGWLDQSVHDVRARAKRQSLPLTITRPTRCLEHGCMLVDKKTGRITIPVPANGFDPTRFLYVGLPEPLSESRFLQINAQDQFYRISSTAHAIALQQYGFAFAYPCYLQYDGTGTVLAPRMSDFARTIFQYFVLYGPIPSGVPIPISEKLSVTISEELRGYINGYPLREQGMSCEICQKPAKSACNSCRTAWYCCREHQTSDWKEHRFWCKKHRVISAASTPHRRDSSRESQSSTQLSETSRSQQQQEDKKVGELETTTVVENVTENLSVPLNVEPSSSGSETKVVAGVEAVNEEKILAPDDDPIVALEEVEVVPSVSSPQQDTLILENSQSVLDRVRPKLSLAPLHDARAKVHRNMKLLVKSFYSWKFYLFIVIIAFIIRSYHLDVHINYPITWQ